MEAGLYLFYDRVLHGHLLPFGGKAKIKAITVQGVRAFDAKNLSYPLYKPAITRVASKWFTRCTRRYRPASVRSSSSCPRETRTSHNPKQTNSNGKLFFCQTARDMQINLTVHVQSGCCLSSKQRPKTIGHRTNHANLELSPYSPIRQSVRPAWNVHTGRISSVYIASIPKLPRVVWLGFRSWQGGKDRATNMHSCVLAHRRTMHTGTRSPTPPSNHEVLISAVCYGVFCSARCQRPTSEYTMEFLLSVLSFGAAKGAKNLTLS